MTLESLADFLDSAFPVEARATLGQLVSIGDGHAHMRLDPLPSMIRPGGIISGPTQMGFIDVAAYAVVLAHIGPVGMAVTNSLSVSFLRPCRQEPLFADARLLKLGRKLASVDVRLWQSDESRLIAQSTVGYALPA
ncbi:PaaI family thioesterase [Sphingobium aquiterrae]|uniref:PaaI family thioesterase n=1 Tax=Sphingobium aquiterrae TaxID=2038656 RepID=UPI003015ACC2